MTYYQGDVQPAWVSRNHLDIAKSALSDALHHCRNAAELRVMCDASPQAMENQLLAAMTALMETPVVPEGTVFIAMGISGTSRTWNISWPPNQELT